MSLFHRHKWEAVGAQVYDTTRIRRLYDVVIDERPGPQVTTVLHRCRTCPQLMTKDIEGVWTLDQINGKQGDN